MPVFFDDPQIYRYIQDELLPRIHTPGSPIRVWALSASNGQEAYSLAMTVAEFQEKHHCQDDARIFATDAAYLNKSKQEPDGVYTTQQVASIPQKLREKYLVPVEGGYQICPKVRKMVVISPYDPLLDPPFSRIELISCRRLLPILCTSCQSRLIHALYQSLTPTGCLLLPSTHPLTDGHMHFAVDEDCPTIWHKLDEEEDMCGWEDDICPATSNTTGRYSFGIPLQRVLQQFFYVFYPNNLVVDENFRIVFAGDEISRRFHLEQPGHSNCLIDHISGDLMQRIQMSAHRLQTAADPKRVNQTLIRANGADRPMYMRMRAILIENRWYYEVGFSAYRPNSNIHDPDKHALEQQLIDTENNLKNKLQELVRAQDQIEVLNEKINSLNHVLENRSWEVRSLRHEVDLLGQELSRLHGQDTGNT